MIWCLLDMTIANADLHTLFPCSFIDYSCMVRSDPRPIVARIEDKVSRKRGQIWFDKKMYWSVEFNWIYCKGWESTTGQSSQDFVSKLITVDMK